MKILIAEDDPVSQRLLEVTLQKWGHEPQTVRDGREAWKLIESGEAPPLWILDWMMPGMEGIELCRRARQLLLPVTPYIILLTALAKVTDMVTGLESGANDYVTKPFQQPELQARINAGIRVLLLQEQLEKRISDLEQALAEVRRLRGIIKICSYCGTVLRSDATWEQIEAYVVENPKAVYSHGICNDCLPRAHRDLGIDEV